MMQFPRFGDRSVPGSRGTRPLPTRACSPISALHRATLVFELFTPKRSRPEPGRHYRRPGGLGDPVLHAANDPDDFGPVNGVASSKIGRRRCADVPWPPQHLVSRSGGLVAHSRVRLEGRSAQREAGLSCWTDRSSSDRLRTELRTTARGAPNTGTASPTLALVGRDAGLAGLLGPCGRALGTVAVGIAGF